MAKKMNLNLQKYTTSQINSNRVSSDFRLLFYGGGKAICAGGGETWSGNPQPGGGSPRLKILFRLLGKGLNCLVQKPKARAVTNYARSFGQVGQLWGP